MMTNIQSLQHLVERSECRLNHALTDLKKEPILFQQVFTPSFVSSLPRHLWFIFILKVAMTQDLRSFDDYFEIERFIELENWQKSKLVRIFGLRFPSTTETFEALLNFSMPIDKQMLDVIKPEHPCFDIMLKQTSSDLVFSWLSEKLKKALSRYKHPANYTAKAKSLLRQGYGWWEHSSLKQLRDFHDIYHVFNSRWGVISTAKLQSDWLVLSILLEDKALFYSLLSREIDINKKASNGMLALVEASGRHGTPWAVNALLESGAEVDLRDGNGFTALFASIANKHHREEVVDSLLVNDANPNIRCFSHSTLLNCFEFRLNENLFNKLIEYGAKNYPAYQPASEFGW